VMVRHSCSSAWRSSAPQRTAITSRARATAAGITSTDRPRLTQPNSSGIETWITATSTGMRSMAISLGTRASEMGT